MIDWAGEPFARLYKRETDDDLLLSWEARAVWHEFLKKCDRNGRLETKRGVRGFAALIRIPIDVVERVLTELIEDGRLRSEPGFGFVAPNYVIANYTPRSAAARMADVRVRQAGTASSGTETSCSDTNGTRHLRDENVTERDDELRDVTQGDAAFPIQIRSDQISAVHRARAREGGRCPIPSGWQPQERERRLAAELGLDVDAEAREFVEYWLGEGKPKADWDRTFAARLHSQAKRRHARTPEPREVKEL